MSAPPDDGALVIASRAGDRDAYCQLVRRHQAGLHAFVARLVMSREDIPDLVQESFIKAYRSLDTFDPARPFGPWIRTICRNLVANHVRDRSTARRHHVRAVEEAILQVASHDESEDVDQRLRALQGCVDGLAGDARDLVRWRYQEGTPVSDIAKRLARSPTAVSMALLRIRAALSRCVQQRLASRVG